MVDNPHVRTKKNKLLNSYNEQNILNLKYAYNIHYFPIGQL